MNYLKRNIIVKKIISFGVAFMMTYSSFSVSVFAADYSASSAVNYAAIHWSDGVGLCDQFVKACLKSGGVTLTSGGVGNVKNELVNKGYGNLSMLYKYGSFIREADNTGRVSAGDVIFFYCSTCGEWKHMAIVGGIDSRGYGVRGTMPFFPVAVIYKPTRAKRRGV